MAMTFDPDLHWTANGPYLASLSVSKEHIATEARIRELLGEMGNLRDVLDVGCGQGRLAAVLKDVLPKAKYSGVDLGAAQIEGTRAVRPDGTFYQSKLQDFQPDRQWDLVLCSEVLMHVPPADIRAVAQTLKAAARRFMLLIEWVPTEDELKRPIDPQNWPHDYATLFGPFSHVERVYRQDIMVVTV